jgi:hypothetical protein
MTNPFSDKESNFAMRHDPEIACEPAGPFDTRVSLPLPVTGSALVALLSLNSNIIVFPSGDTHVFEVATVFPFFLSTSSIVLSSTTLMLTES